jgi:hypothetical protein
VALATRAVVAVAVGAAVVGVGVVLAVVAAVDVAVAVAVAAVVAVGVGVLVLVAGGVGVGWVTVKKIDDSTPHLPLLLEPCTRRICLPLESALVSTWAITLAVEPPKLPLMGIPVPSGPGSSI